MTRSPVAPPFLTECPRIRLPAERLTCRGDRTQRIGPSNRTCLWRTRMTVAKQGGRDCRLQPWARAASADMAAIAGFDASASRCRMTVRNSTGRTATPARSLPRALRNSDPAAAVRLPSGRGVAPSSGCLPADSNPRSALSEVFCMARDRWTWPVISRTSCLTFFPRYSCLPTPYWKASAYPIPRAIQRAVPRAAATHARLHRCTSS